MSSEQNFEIIYKDYFPRIHKYLVQLVGQFQAEDLTQEVFNKIHKGLPKFKGESKLSTWIYRIATNTAIDKTRTKSFKTELKTSPAEDKIDKPDQNGGAFILAKPPEQEIIKEEMNQCIEEFIERLPYNYKTVLILSEYEHLKNKEIAQILNISLDTVKIRLHRAKAKLKKELDAGCDFYHDENSILSCDRKQPPPIPSKNVK